VSVVWKYLTAAELQNCNVWSQDAMWFEDAQQYRAGLICSVLFPRLLLLLVTTRLTPLKSVSSWSCIFIKRIMPRFVFLTPVTHLFRLVVIPYISQGKGWGKKWWSQLHILILYWFCLIVILEPRSCSKDNTSSALVGSDPGNCSNCCCIYYYLLICIFFNVHAHSLTS
jgi:hypothetical protein